VAAEHRLHTQKERVSKRMLQGRLVEE
jgi:hypothetical protein